MGKCGCNHSSVAVVFVLLRACATSPRKLRAHCVCVCACGGAALRARRRARRRPSGKLHSGRAYLCKLLVLVRAVSRGHAASVSNAVSRARVCVCIVETARSAQCIVSTQLLAERTAQIWTRTRFVVCGAARANDDDGDSNYDDVHVDDDDDNGDGCETRVYRI